MNTVVFITGLFPPDHCGIGDFTAQLSEEMTKMGSETYVITSKNQTNESNNPSSHILRIISAWKFSAFKEIRKALSPFDAKNTIVNLQYPSAGFGKNLFVNLLPWLLRFRGYKIAVTAHEYSSFSRKGKLRVLFTLFPAHKKIVVSDTEKNALPKFFQKRVSVIPIGSNMPVHQKDETTIQGLRTKLGIQTGDPVLLFFGNIQPQKGFLELLEAFSQVRKRLPRTKLLLIGARVAEKTGSFDADYEKKLTPYFHEVKTFIEKNNLADFIIQPGYIDRDEMSQYFFLGTLAVFPFQDGATWRRGSLLAALAHGIPTLSTFDEKNTPAEMKSIAFAPTKNPNELSKILLEYLSGESPLQELSLAAQELTRHIDWPSIAKKTQEFFQ